MMKFTELSYAISKLMVYRVKDEPEPTYMVGDVLNVLGSWYGCEYHQFLFTANNELRYDNSIPMEDIQYKHELPHYETLLDSLVKLNDMCIYYLRKEEWAEKPQFGYIWGMPRLYNYSDKIKSMPIKEFECREGIHYIAIRGEINREGHDVLYVGNSQAISAAESVKPYKTAGDYAFKKERIELLSMTTHKILNHLRNFSFLSGTDLITRSVVMGLIIQLKALHPEKQGRL